MTTSTDQLERETERSRDRVANLLDELRDKATPGDVLNHVLGHKGQDAASDILHKLGEQARANPLPVVLVGTGLAWLMMSDNKPSSRATTGAVGTSAHYGSAGYGDASSDGSGMGEMATRAGEQMGEHGRHLKDQASAALSSAGERTRDTMSSVQEKASHLAGKVSDLTSSVSHRMDGSGQRAMDGFRQMLEEQPLVVAGIGLALGAALGAAFPTTRAENRLFGETSDEIKHQAQAVAHDSMEKAKEAAAHTYETAREQVKQEAERAAESLRADGAQREGQAQGQEQQVGMSGDQQGYDNPYRPH